ncbi:capsular biosynthesis protein [Allopusillimonas soli]|uniref:Capsular biosynthesis protein n=1 Tax=Allopusillimonas soli TaxID=659016 RepID=A0A853F8N3_9BURK|nr:capsular biosynthesis protein [Allopusillimonas soli]NYT37014.1 capsular biosynthesis protein [Allopusillimonas soli]TEA75459.1 capsular biosynthesis protein [Allopusillimonas soli]
MTRSFLFLQGVCSPFFSRLGKRLNQEGHQVVKVNFNGGDAAFWNAGGAVPWRGGVDGLTDFYQDIYHKHGVTDVVLFGDQRPVHRPAIDLAKRQQVRVHVYEEGYFRPNWLTLEREGVNGHSTLPRDPQWYREAARKVPRYRNGRSLGPSFKARAWHDIRYHICNLGNRWTFPEYKTHAPVSAWKEYSGYLVRSTRIARRKQVDAANIARLINDDRAFYLLPLQLDSDAQIRTHSRFRTMVELMEQVMESFAAHAASDAVLVVKNHPLDPGLVPHGRIARDLAGRYGIADRIVFLETGHLPTLLSNATGVVTVNSTVGGSALVHSRPLIALGQPIYGIPGLTFQGTLDAFWHDHEPPDMGLFHNFRNVVIHTTQVNGGFYTEKGIDMGVEQSVGRLTAVRSRLDVLA